MTGGPMAPKDREWRQRRWRYAFVPLVILVGVVLLLAVILNAVTG